MFKYVTLFSEFAEEGSAGGHCEKPNSRGYHTGGHHRGAWPKGQGFHYIEGWRERCVYSDICPCSCRKTQRKVGR